MGQRLRRSAVKAWWWGCVVLLVVLVAAPAAAAMRGASGSRAWTWTYAGSQSQAQIRKVLAAPNGSTYAVGSTESNGNDQGDVLISRFTGSGKEPAWTRTWDGGVAGDYPWSAAVDRMSNVAVGGMTKTASASDDWLVLKYSPSGKLLWSATLGGEYASSDYLNDVVCDRAGNVYACGGLLDAKDNHCFTVAKFRASDGKLLWKQVEPGLNADWHDDQAMAVDVDASGNVYATGISFDATRTDRRCLTIKLTPGGDVKWRKVIASPTYDRYGYFLSVVGSSMYVSCFGDVAGGSFPLMVARYTTGGHLSWLKTREFAGVTEVYPMAMAANKTGVVVAGSAFGAATLIAKLTPSGAPAWSHVYVSSDTRFSRDFTAVCMDADGRVWTAGSSRPAAPDAINDWLVQRFSPGGRSVWMKTWGGAAGGYDGLSSAALGGGSTLFVSGYVGTADGSVSLPAVGKYVR